MKGIGSKAKIYLLTAAVGVSTLIGVATPSFASEEGRRNTALALSAATIYQASKGNTPEAFLFGAGAVAAWDRVNDRDRHHRRFVYARPYPVYAPPYPVYVPTYPVYVNPYPQYYWYGGKRFERDDHRRWDRDHRRWDRDDHRRGDRDDHRGRDRDHRR